GNGDFGKILFTNIHDVRKDGIYFSESAKAVEIANCHFFNINMTYFDNPPNSGYGEATGDAIQLEAINCSGARIHHNIFDRGNTGHKFNLIINGFKDGVPSEDIIIEHNISIGPKKTAQQSGAGFYISCDSPLIVRCNQFYDAPTAFENRSRYGEGLL
ncbi:MAG: hypothetical protein IH594_12935, partial [Bacteroidales bacterium]|nr:hypothetical protein [Bacteroidales bacterium]